MTQPAITHLTQTAVATLPLADDTILSAQTATLPILCPRRQLCQSKQLPGGSVSLLSDRQRLGRTHAQAICAHPERGSDEMGTGTAHLAHLV